MKKSLSLAFMAAAIFLVFSCKTTKSSVSASGKSETLALQASRLDSTLMIDNFQRWMCLSVDSMVMILSARDGDVTVQGSSVAGSEGMSSNVPLDDMYFLSSKPPADGHGYGAAAKWGTISPSELKLYGLHVDEGMDKGSVKQSSSVDSLAAARQSSLSEERSKRKSSPDNSLRYVFYILVIATGVFLFHRIQHKA